MWHQVGYAFRRFLKMREGGQKFQVFQFIRKCNGKKNEIYIFIDALLILKFSWAKEKLNFWENFWLKYDREIHLLLQFTSVVETLISSNDNSSSKTFLFN